MCHYFYLFKSQNFLNQQLRSLRYLNSAISAYICQWAQHHKDRLAEITTVEYSYLMNSQQQKYVGPLWRSALFFKRTSSLKTYRAVCSRKNRPNFARKCRHNCNAHGHCVLSSTGTSQYASNLLPIIIALLNTICNIYFQQKQPFLCVSTYEAKPNCPNLSGNEAKIRSLDQAQYHYLEH